MNTRQIQAIKQKQELNIRVLGALRLLSQIWKLITATIICNCFLHESLKSSTPTPATIIDDEDDVIPLAQLSRLPVAYDDYTRNNEAVLKSETLSDQDSIEDIIQTRKSENVTVISKKNQHPRSTTTNRKDGGRGMHDDNIIILRVTE